MKVAVIGGAGNMGQRYCRILDHLKVENFIIDRYEAGFSENEKHLGKATHIIIASPTMWHVTHLEKYSKYDVPMLCEKPICKTRAELERVLKIKPFVRMINQYQFYKVNDDYHGGRTYYNYFKTGGDTLNWDCINIIGLAESDFKIENTSPIWDCWINGHRLHLCDMDSMYIRNIEDWLNYNYDNKAYIKHAHEKIFNLEGIT